jgi:hypothetical protein
MVGNHAGYFDLQFAAAPAVQQIVEAVILLADQNDQALFLCRIAQLPVHRKLLRHHPKVHAQS